MPYGALRQVEHALCNAHHLRELKALIEFDGEAWATPMRDMLLAANAAVCQARDTGARPSRPNRSTPWSKAIGRRCGRAWPSIAPCPASSETPGPAAASGTGPDLPADPFKTRKDDVLRFLVDFDVPFTNNLAEQDIRMTKVKMKISCAFRTLAGAKNFACLRSIVSTARKQSYDILQILAATPDQISQALPA